MKIIIGLLVCLFLGLTARTQPPNANWTFGDYNGLKFLSNGQVELFESIINVSQSQCLATISDSLGNLLFYLYPYDTRAAKLINANHEPVLNGDTINANNSTANAAIIIPKPNNPYFYYLYTRGGGLG